MIISAAEWCKTHFKAMNDRQFWILPRTGMVFVKLHGVLFWCASIPPKEKFGVSARKARVNEFNVLFEEFSRVDINLGMTQPMPEFKTAEQAVTAVLQRLPDASSIQTIKELH